MYKRYIKLSDYPIINPSFVLSKDTVLRYFNIAYWTSSGVYAMLPNGIWMLWKLNHFIWSFFLQHVSMEELNLPILTLRKILYSSKRNEEWKNDLFFINDYILSPTAEEVITSLFQSLNLYWLHSSNQLIFFQIGKKFWREDWPWKGLIRTKEFIMKDAYSFHLSNRSSMNTFNKFDTLYCIFFKHLGLPIVWVHSYDVASMKARYSIEYIFPHLDGSSTYIKCLYCDYIFSHSKTINWCIKCNHIKLWLLKGVELAHIFNLGNFYAKSINFKINNIFPIMCSYGIGVTRIIQCILMNYLYKDLWLPKIINPFNRIVLIKYYWKNYTLPSIEQDGECFIDDRHISISKKIWDAKIIGFNNILIHDNLRNLTDQYY